MIDRIDVVYIKNEIELPCLIRSGVVYDKNQTTQWRDQSIGLVYAEIKTELFKPTWPGTVCDEN